MSEPRYLLVKSLPMEVLSSTGGSVIPEGKTERRTFAGFKLVIENPVGTVREGVDETGKPWRTEFQHAYGEITGSLGVDGDPVDVYLGDDEAATEVYIVRQMKRKDWDKFDEDKCFLGFPSMEAAKQAYLNHYDDPRFFGGIIAMPIEEFRVKVRATKDNPTMLKTLILFTKAHIAGHTRTLKTGKVVRVNAYDNKVVGRGKPGAPGQADLFGGVQVEPEPASGKLTPEQRAWAERTWRDQDYLPWAQVEKAREMLGHPKDEDAELLRTPEGREKVKAKISQAKPETDWRDEENWHSRTMGRMKTLDDAALRYVVKDATEAAESLERDGSTSKKAGQYRDEAHYASMELKRRRDTPVKQADKASLKVEQTGKQTNSPAFKRWFGGSKVVDAKGEPLVVYHGSRADIPEFDPSMAPETRAKAMFFSPDKDTASSFAIGDGGNVAPVYLSMKNPLEFEFNAAQYASPYYEKMMMDEAIRAGHDGMVITSPGRQTMYVAFRSEQIKSAVGNNGNFDPNDASLTKSQRITIIRRAT